MSPRAEMLPVVIVFVLAVCALVLLVLLFPAQAWAATRYVSPQGNDSNSCATSQAPGASAKRTLNGAQGAMLCMQAGDTLVLQNGVWNEQLSDYDDQEHPGAKRPPNGLSWDKPTILKAEQPRGATLNKPQPQHPYNHVVFLARPDTQYLSVEGLVLDGRGHGACVWVGPASHIRFTGNLIKDCGRNGIFGSVADDGSGLQDVHLLDNEITNFSIEETGYPGAHGVYFTGSHSVARGNYIHAPCPFYGLHYTSEHGGLYSNVIENNRVVGCHQSGIFSQGRDSIIRNNLLENNCIGIYLSSAPTLVANNTVYGWHTAWNCSDSYGIFDKSGGSTLSNNVLLQQKIYLYAHATPPTLQTNLCDAPAVGCQLTAQPGSVVMDGPGGNLTLKPGGPAVNTGTTLAAVPTDRLGVSRPQGAGVDIGAYEQAGGTPPPSGDTQAPTIQITAPRTGDLVSGTSVPLSAVTTDNVGVVGVQFYLNDTPVGAVQCCVTVDVFASTTHLANGAYTLAAEAWDAAGQRTRSAPVEVRVANGPIGPPQPRPPADGPMTCTGDIATVPGPITMQCQPVTGRR
jgi:Right handed beta helix region/Bacterial Ig domain